MKWTVVCGSALVRLVHCKNWEQLFRQTVFANLVASMGWRCVSSINARVGHTCYWNVRTLFWASRLVMSSMRMSVFRYLPNLLCARPLRSKLCQIFCTFHKLGKWWLFNECTATFVPLVYKTFHNKLQVPQITDKWLFLSLCRIATNKSSYIKAMHYSFCDGNPLVTAGLPSQIANDAEM